MTVTRFRGVRSRVPRYNDEDGFWICTAPQCDEAAVGELQPVCCPHCGQPMMRAGRWLRFEARDG